MPLFAAFLTAKRLARCGMATIRDVANRAQVSTATVSAVVNDSAYVSPELRTRVLAAVSELKYTPSVAAPNLKRGRRPRQSVLRAAGLGGGGGGGGLGLFARPVQQR